MICRCIEERLEQLQGLEAVLVEADRAEAATARRVTGGDSAGSLGVGRAAGCDEAAVQVASQWQWTRQCVSAISQVKLRQCAGAGLLLGFLCWCSLVLYVN